MAGRHQLLLLIALLSVFVGGAHLLAVQFSLYWLLSWFDVIPHFFAGALVAVVGVYVWMFWNYNKTQFFPQGAHIFWITLGSALIIGVGWEVFEYMTDLVEREYHGLDTSIDVVMDTLGGISMYALLVHTRFRSMLQ